MLIVAFSSSDLALRVDGDLLREVALRDRGRHVGDRRAPGSVRLFASRFTLSVQAAPGAGDAFDRRPGRRGLPFGADLARDARHLGGEASESWSTIVLIVELRAGRSRPSSRSVIFCVEVAARDGRRHLGDRCAPGRSGCRPSGSRSRSGPRQVPETPSTCGLAAELALGADLAGDARHLGRERRSWSTIVLIVLFSSSTSPRASTVIFFERSPFGDRGRHLGDVPHLVGEVVRERVHALGQVRARCRRRLRPGPGRRACPSVPTSRATRVTSAANEESWSTIVLIVSLSSRISPLDVDGDLLREVAVRDRGRDRRRCCGPGR